MDHTVFILAAYGVAALGLLALAAYTLLDYRAQTRALAELEARGVRRRSQAAAPPPAEGKAEGRAS